MDFPPNNYCTRPLRKRARSPKTSPASFLDDHNNRRRRYEHDHLIEKLINNKPLIFDGEVKQGEEVETWLVRIQTFF